MTRIANIVDNQTAEGFVAEHGLSLLIKHGDERILFDTGAGLALRPNAAKLGIDLNDVSRIVLSHSHNDHTGGLGGLVPKCPIYIGDGFDVPCFSKHADGHVRSLAVPPAAKAVLSVADVRVCRQFSEIAKGVYLSGRIERMSGEDNGGLHLCHATDDEIGRTGDFLGQLNLDRIILLHCTGEVAGAKLKEMLSCPVVWGSAGGRGNML